MAEYSEIIQALVDTVRKLEIRFRIHERTEELDTIFFRKLVLCLQDAEFPFFADDEYNDVDQGNPVFLFNMVLLECESIELTDSFESWCADVGLPADTTLSKTIFDTNHKSSVILKQKLPDDVTPVPFHEIEFGTSVATALRNATLHDPLK